MKVFFLHIWGVLLFNPASSFNNLRDFNLRIKFKGLFIIHFTIFILFSLNDSGIIVLSDVNFLVQNKLLYSLYSIKNHGTEHLPSLLITYLKI